MYQTMTQIGKKYGVDAKTVGKILYDLKIRDANHPEQKGFPFEQAVTHGIAKANTGRNGDKYFQYDIDRIKEEFEARIKQLRGETSTPMHTALAGEHEPHENIEHKLNEMLKTLNDAIRSGNTSMLHTLKGHIADIFGLLRM